ncbi:hypothetical protein [Nocardia asiatica]|uniref:hypothetical protein n=1 Tax=Nocardia asiatica TaxID=209252 RepID=UPI003EE1D635
MAHGVGSAACWSSHITGTGSGKTKPAAVAAAKKDADRSVPQGHYKRHCKEI